MTRRPPAEAARWVERSVGPGARVVRIRRLRNAWAAAMHTVDVEHRGVRHRLVLRRWVRTDIPPDIGVVENEAAVLTLLEAHALPVPRLVAADPAGRDCDVPAVLMTRVDGRDVVAPSAVDAWLDGLATTLLALQEVSVPPGILGYYRPWSLDTVTSPPPWTRLPSVWEHAIEIANQGVPNAPRVLCHRDYHPGNVLWQRARVSGVVDWTHACRGAAAADVAHCRLNIAQLCGFEAAEAFARRYGPVEHLPWFEVADAVSAGEQPPDAWRWHDAGRTDITTDGLIDSLDAFLVQAVARYG